MSGTLPPRDPQNDILEDILEEAGHTLTPPAYADAPREATNDILEGIRLSLSLGGGGGGGDGYTEAEADNRFVNVTGDAMEGILFIADGTVGAPSIAFTLDVNTGFYRPSADVLGIAAAGTAVLQVGGTQVEAFQPVHLPNGSVSFPSLTFSSDQDTGLYRVAANTLGIATDGTIRVSIGSASISTTLPIVLPGVPTAVSHAATKGYVDDLIAGLALGIPDAPADGNSYARKDNGWVVLSSLGHDLPTLDARYVQEAGDTMTGALTLSGPPTMSLHAVTKVYVDDLIAGGTAVDDVARDAAADAQATADLKVAKAGDTMTGSLIFNDTVSVNHIDTENLGGLRLGQDGINVLTLKRDELTTRLHNGVAPVDISVAQADQITFLVPVITDNVQVDRLAFDLAASSDGIYLTTDKTELKIDGDTLLTVGKISAVQYVSSSVGFSGANHPTHGKLLFNQAVPTVGISVDASGLGLSPSTISGALQFSANDSLHVRRTSGTDPIRVGTTAMYTAFESTAFRVRLGTGDLFWVTHDGVTETAGFVMPVSGADPIDNDHFTTKQYVDGLADNYVLKAGDTMTGALILHADPTVDLQAATKGYVDDQISGGSAVDSTARSAAAAAQADADSADANASSRVSRAGDTMTGALYLSGAPTADLQAATKLYVDGLISGGTAVDSTARAAASAAQATADLKVAKAGDTMTGALAMHDGLVATPAITFAADLNTGIYRVGEDTIGISTGGAQRMSIGAATSINGALSVSSTVSGALVHATTNGTAAAPAYSFGSDPDTGLYRIAANTIALSTNGTLRLSLDEDSADFTVPVIVPNASADDHALNRITADGRYVDVTGDTMTGALYFDNPGATNGGVSGSGAFNGTMLFSEPSGTRFTVIPDSSAIFDIEDTSSNLRVLTLNRNGDSDQFYINARGDGTGRIFEMGAMGSTILQYLTDEFWSPLNLEVYFPLSVPDATQDDHALNRLTADARYVNVTGDTMSGALYIEDSLGGGHLYLGDQSHIWSDTIAGGGRLFTEVAGQIVGYCVVNPAGPYVAFYGQVQAPDQVPTAPKDLVPKDFLDTTVAGLVHVAGDTMTGGLYFYADSLMGGASQTNLIEVNVTEANNFGPGTNVSPIRVMDGASPVFEVNQYGGIGLGTSAPDDNGGVNLYGNLVMGSTVGFGGPDITLSRGTGSIASLTLSSAGVKRAAIMLQGAESGAEGDGGDLKFWRYTNAGVGTESVRFTRATGAAQFQDGSTTIPGIGFLNDTDTGLYRSASNRIALVAGGLTRAEFQEYDHTITARALRVDGNLVGPSPGGASTVDIRLAPGLDQDGYISWWTNPVGTNEVRWWLRSINVSADLDDGSNVGSDLALRRWADAGTALSDMIVFNRQNGDTRFMTVGTAANPTIRFSNSSHGINYTGSAIEFVYNGAARGSYTASAFSLGIPLAISHNNSNGNTILQNGAGVALKITNQGTGDSLLVEDAASTDTTPFVIKNDGKVGIGTDTPADLLHVNNGYIRLQNDTTAAIQVINTGVVAQRRIDFRTADVARWIMFVDSTAEGGSNAGSNFSLIRYDDAGVSLGTVLAITRSTGNLGINFSAHATAKLHVVAALAADAVVDAEGLRLLNGNTVDGASVDIQFATSSGATRAAIRGTKATGANAGELSFYTYTVSTPGENLRLRQDLSAQFYGKVGVGVTPTAELDVVGSIAFTGNITGSGANLTSLNASNLSSGTVGTARLGSGTANSGTFLRGDGTWAAVPGTSGFMPVVLNLASDFVSSAVALANVTDLSQAVSANEVWLIEIYGKYRTAATTTGAGLALSIPTGASISGFTRLRQAAAGTDSFYEYELVVSDANFASASVVAANTDYACYLQAMVVMGANSGNIVARWRSEVAASNATLKAGTRMIATRVA